MRVMADIAGAWRPVRGDAVTWLAELIRDLLDDPGLGALRPPWTS
jgi:hypothetical protein